MLSVNVYFTAHSSIFNGPNAFIPTLTYFLMYVFIFGSFYFLFEEVVLYEKEKSAGLENQT